MQKEFNFIYDKLVTDRNDILGHIAYSIYKQEKTAFIKSKEEKGETISRNILDPFHEISASNASIESYKIKAELVMQVFFRKYYK